MNFSKIRTKLLIVCGLCVALAATGITYALLTTKGDTTINTFSGANAKINISVVESGKTGEFEDAPDNNVIYGTIGKNETVNKVVQIKNKEGSADAYVRVKLIPVIVSDTNADEMLGKQVNVTLRFSKSNKWKVQDDTYYFTEPVASGALSDTLLESVTLNEALPDGYHLVVQVLADAVATDSIQTAWKLSSNDIASFASIK